MNHQARIVLSLGATLAVGVHAQLTPGLATDRPRDPAVEVDPTMPLTSARFNAGMQYHTEWMLMPELLEYVEGLESRDTLEIDALPAEYVDLLISHADGIERIIEASRLQNCDFGINYDRGFAALIPELRVLRQTCRIMVQDAVRLADNDIDAAVDRLCAAIRIGDHTSQTGTIIGSLVGMVLVDFTGEQIHGLIETGALTAKHADLISQALGRINADDPYYCKASVRSERDVMAIWIKTEFLGTAAGLQFSKEFTIIGGEPPLAGNPIENLTGTELAKQVDKASSVYDLFLAAWDTPDAAQRLSTIETGVADGDYGIFAQIMVPAISRFHSKSKESEGYIMMLQNKLMLVP